MEANRDENKIQITEESLSSFFDFLEADQKGSGTVEAYQRALYALYDYLPEEKCACVSSLTGWQNEMISSGYALRTVNTRTSAVNSFLEYMGRRELQIPPVSIPKNNERPELTRAEYLRLLHTAKLEGKERIYFIMKTICCAGVRVQELPQITAEAVESGHVTLRGQCGDREVQLPAVLRRELKEFAERRGILSGPLFLTRSGTPVNRVNISSSIKKLCRDAQVSEEKGNPRCLLKLYQNTYENIQNSISDLVQREYLSLLEQEQVTAGWDAR